MRIKAKTLTLLCIGAMYSCAPLVNDRADLIHPGMKKIHSAGVTFLQGWNDTSAMSDEKPATSTTFTNDFWIDTTEVTQKSFYLHTGRYPVPDSAYYGRGDDYPVHYVSWFDAVLYCNARSKAEQLDTCYRYSRINILSNGSAYELTGIQYDFSKDGYRLPTEAEWEFAARGNSDVPPFHSNADSTYALSVAWFASNAGGTTHPVAQKAANSSGLYDMAGNVFEWTNDWKSGYDGKSISDPFGGIQPDNDYEKVIKGGSFMHGLPFLRPTIRSATYPTSLSTSVEYVGFRCARGVIPGRNYRGLAQQVTALNPVTIMADHSTLKSFLKTSNARFVFVNVTGRLRSLCYIDFNNTFPFVTQFTDDSNVYFPVISPDGRFVAYGNKNEGFFGPAKISIRSLDATQNAKIILSADSAYIPRWWVNPMTGDTGIVYTNSSIVNGSSLWKSTRTIWQKISGGLSVGTPQDLIPDGSFHDGISSNGQYAISGYDRLMMRNLQTNQESQLFLSPQNGKNAAGSNQVCNASISPYGATCLFLDFGYPLTSSITQCRYGIHQCLFIATMSDSITGFIQCPSDASSWDYPEWSNQVQYAVSSLRDLSYAANQIVAVDLQNKDSITLVTGIELQQPGLWVDSVMVTPYNFCLDSIGLYDDPHLSPAQEAFAYKMHFFWKKHDELELVFVGNSLIDDGIDCEQFTQYSTYNLGFVGSGFLGIINYYVLPHCSNLKLIGLPIPFYNFGMNVGFDKIFYGNEADQSKGYYYDLSHNFWRDSIPRGFYEVMVNVPYPRLQDQGWRDTVGFLWPNPCISWRGSNPALEGDIGWTVDSARYQKNIADFEEMIITLSARQIHFLAINFPKSPYYKYTDHYTRYGPNWETGRAVLAQLKALELKYPYFHVYDAYQDGNHDYTDSDAFDYNHLCRSGAAKFSARLDSLVQVILNK